MNLWERALLSRGYLPEKEQELKMQQMQQMQAQRDQRIGGLLGAPEKAYQMSEAEMFPGENQIPGLKNQGSGLLGGEIGPAEFYGGLLSTPGYEQIGARGLEGLLGMGGGAQRSPYSNIQIDDSGNAFGLSSQTNQFEPIPIAGAGRFDKKKKFAEGELASASYANRMAEAQNLLGEIEKSGFDPADTLETVKASVPLLGNYLASPEFQTYRQAQSDWVRAKLRKESGAVIGEEEMDAEIKTYFPRPGDSKEVIAQKRASREKAMQSLVSQSQGAYGANFTPPPAEGKAGGWSIKRVN